MKRLITFSILSSLLWIVALNATAQDDQQLISKPALDHRSLSTEVEDLKKTLLNLNRDMLILEEELLFPSNTQIALFLSVDVGTFFQLSAVKLNINGKPVASHLYTETQVDALHRGGVQRLHIGNLRSGTHEISAFFIGTGPEGRDYKRATSLKVTKTQDPLLLELVIEDSERAQQPEFSIKEWDI